jgi:hypothetical protein
MSISRAQQYGYLFSLNINGVAASPLKLAASWIVINP